MTITVERRLATAEEVTLLERQWLPPRVYALLMALAALVMYFILSLGVLMVLAAVLSGTGGQRLNDAIYSAIKSAPWVEQIFIFVLWGPVFIVPICIAWRRFHRLRRARMGGWRDQQDALVEVILIEDEQFSEVVARQGGPYLIFDMGQARAFLVSRYTLYHHICWQRASGVLDEMDDDPSDAEVDAVFARYMPLFPAQRVELWRWPGTGDVFYIAGEGEVPESVSERRMVLEKLVPQHSRVSLGDSTIVSGWTPMAR